MLPSAAAVIRLQDTLTRAWHLDEVPAWEPAPAFEAIAENHARNFELWHLEDHVRDTTLSDAEIVRGKRWIDESNAARNRAIEEIDRIWVAAWPWIVEEGPLPLNTETVGSVADRLSIAALKVYHLAPGSSCPENSLAAEMRHRRGELARAFDTLLSDLALRRRRVLPPGQAKLYSSPAFDPRTLACGGWPPERAFGHGRRALPAPPGKTAQGAERDA